MLSRSPPKPAKFTRQRTDGYRSAPVSSSYAQTSRSIAMTPKQVDWPQAHSDPQIANCATASDRVAYSHGQELNGHSGGRSGCARAAAGGSTAVSIR